MATGSRLDHTAQEVDDAIEIVLELARKNAVDEKHKAAVDTIEDFFVNVVFKDED